MKRGLLIALVLCLGCQSSYSQDADQYTIDYALGANRYGVVVAEDGGISRRQAKEIALQKAAAVAHEHGYQYFILDREEMVKVMRTQDSSRSGPKNLYYSMIQSSDFGRDAFEMSEANSSSQVSGYQIEFSCQEAKPAGGRYYDVCDYGFCN